MNEEKINFYQRDIDHCKKTIEELKLRIIKYEKILEGIKNE